MQSKENNSTVVFLWNTTNPSKPMITGLGFITNDLKSIKKLQTINYSFIKYNGVWNIADSLNQSEKIEAHIIKFENMPEQLLKSIHETIEQKIENENIGEYDAIDFVIKLFSKIKFKKEVKEELLGDIGELVFMLKCKDLGIKADEKIRSLDTSVYDFNFNRVYVEVKSTTKNMSEIIVDERQLEECNEKIFVVSKYQLLEKNSIDKVYNICELYDLLNSSNELILYKKNKYESWCYDETLRKLIDECCLLLDKVECFILDNSILPKIHFEHKGGLKKLKCHIDVTNCKTNSIEELKKYI